MENLDRSTVAGAEGNTNTNNSHIHGSIRIGVEGLAQKHALIFRYNDLELGRIDGKDHEEGGQSIDFQVHWLRVNETVHNRPWYNEDVIVDVYDTTNAKKSTYDKISAASFFSTTTKSSSTDSWDRIKAGVKVGEMHLRARDSVANRARLDLEEESDFNENDQSSIHSSIKEQLDAIDELDWGGKTYDTTGTGRWYKVVRWEGEGAGEKSKEKSKETSFDSETDYMLLDMLYSSWGAQNSSATARLSAPSSPSSPSSPTETTLATEATSAAYLSSTLTSPTRTRTTSSCNALEEEAAFRRQVSLRSKGLFLCTVGVLFDVECCIR